MIVFETTKFIFSVIELTLSNTANVRKNFGSAKLFFKNVYHPLFARF